ncbi:MAG TPA: hypothetical protein VME17_07330 [Bryobacteraceae bacterium]|nr:hypothetical protein [Bryobacteraceae bacterium]
MPSTSTFQAAAAARQMSYSFMPLQTLDKSASTESGSNSIRSASAAVTSGFGIGKAFLEVHLSDVFERARDPDPRAWQVKALAHHAGKVENLCHHHTVRAARQEISHVVAQHLLGIRGQSTAGLCGPDRTGLKDTGLTCTWAPQICL